MKLEIVLKDMAKDTRGREVLARALTRRMVTVRGHMRYSLRLESRVDVMREKYGLLHV
jgi:hypothetical protein